MNELSNAIRAWLEMQIHPSAPWLILTALVFASIYAVRRWAPTVWERLALIVGPEQRVLSNVIQGLPAAMLGALATVLLEGGDFGEAWKGALFGSLAPFVHWAFKLLPGPYQGGSYPAASKAQPSPRASMNAIVIVFGISLTGCGFFAAAASAYEQARPWVRRACDLLLAEEAERAGVSLEDVADGARKACESRLLAAAQEEALGVRAGLQGPSAARDAGAP